MKRLILPSFCAILLTSPVSATATEIVLIPFDFPVWMSADGKWFGEAQFSSESALWSPDTGFRNLGTMPSATRTIIAGISADGSVAVGDGIAQSPSGQIVRQEPFRWTEAGIVGLGNLTGSTISRVNSVSDDGATVVGHATVAGKLVPWIWTERSGMAPFALPASSTAGILSGVSGNGGVVAGTLSLITGDRGFVWDAKNAFQLLPPGANNGLSSRMSADGSTVAGRFSNASNLYRWSQDAGLTVIGLPSEFGFVNDITADGSVIVGYLSTQAGVENFRAFVWDEQHGAQDIRQVLLRDHGFSDDLPVFNEAYNISANATTLSTVTYLVEGAASIARTQYGIYLDKPLVELDKSAWKVDVDGSFSHPANWTSDVPNAAGAIALLSNSITFPRTVTIDVPITLGQIELNSVNTYTIAGSNVLTLDGSFGPARINVVSGTHIISAPISLADNSVITVRASAGHLTITRGLDASEKSLTKAGEGLLTLNNVRLASLSVNGGAVAIAPNSGNAVLGALSLAGEGAPTARLDLSNNGAIVDYTGTSPAITVRQQILSGRGGAGFGQQWNGPGITSSTAAAANVAEPESLSVGYAENSALPLGPYATFRGQTVDDTSLLIAYTRTGDANLDGIVNDDDVTIVGASYAPGVPQPRWSLGDFDYNGFVDDDDVTLLGAFYDPSAPPLIAVAEAVSAGVPVPEPATSALSLMAAVAALALRRRRG